MTRLMKTRNGYALGDRVYFKAAPFSEESKIDWMITDIQLMDSGKERVEVLLETDTGAHYANINSEDITRRAD